MNLVITERTHVRASRQAVGRILEDVSNMPLWNPKCVRVERSEGCATNENSFVAVFKMNGPEVSCSGKVTEFVPLERIGFEYASNLGSREGIVRESFELRESSTGTAISHRVDMSEARMPWLLKLAMKMLYRFGRKGGPSSLDCLKELLAMR